MKYKEEENRPADFNRLASPFLQFSIVCCCILIVEQTHNTMLAYRLLRLSSEYWNQCLAVYAMYVTP